MGTGRVVCTGLVLAVAGCAIDSESVETSEQAANVLPWKQPAKWPYQVESPRVIVHYQAAADQSTAQSVLADVEHAWTEQITNSGGRAPIDGGTIGPDARYDVWLQRGIDTLYVTSTGTNPATTYDDAFTSMVLDPWGQYGGAEMPANVFHEFRHGSQGTDDWNEHIWMFEAEATLWETSYYGYPRLSYVWADVQAHPDWTPFKNDRYTTWFMYGGALFLLYVKNHVFNGQLAWSNDTWLRCRNPAGTNEPDFYDALGQVLAPKGTTVLAELTSFTRARWYTGARANGAIEAGDQLPDVATSVHTRASGATHTTFQAAPQMLGTTYVRVQRAATDGTSITVSLASVASGARAVVQVVGQGSADRVLDLSTPKAVAFVGNEAVLAVTLQPANGQFDPDTVGTQTVKATLAFDR